MKDKPVETVSKVVVDHPEHDGSEARTVSEVKVQHPEVARPAASRPPTTTGEEDLASSDARSEESLRAQGVRNEERLRTQGQRDEDALRTAEQRSAASLRTAGQRMVNMVWEYTQSYVAVVVVTTTAVGIFIGRVVQGPDAPTPFPAEWWTIVGLVIGFYFGRTNHARIGDDATTASTGKAPGLDDR